MDTPLSTETLRAELGQLELRLVDRLRNELDKKADASVVHTLLDRVQVLELSRAQREHLSADVVELQSRVAIVEDRGVTAEAVAGYRRWLHGALLGGGLGGIVAVADLFLRLTGH